MPRAVARIALCGLWLAHAAAWARPGVRWGTAAPAAATRRPAAARTALHVLRAQESGFDVLRELNPILRADEEQLTDDLQFNLEGRGPVNNFDGGPVSINLEGHFKPQVGFIPHAFRVDGDFASGDPRFALKYDVGAGCAASSVEVCGVGPTYEDFVAGFAPTSDQGWSVDPADGCLDVKDGDPDVLTVQCVCSERIFKNYNTPSDSPPLLTAALPKNALCGRIGAAHSRERDSPGTWGRVTHSSSAHWLSSCRPRITAGHSGFVWSCEKHDRLPDVFRKYQERERESFIRNYP